MQPSKVASTSPARPADIASDNAAATPDKSTAPSAHAGTGGAALQIGAYKSEEEASAAWSAFSRKHAMVSAYSEQVKKVDLGEKGIWYRLRLAGFSDRSAAQAFCEKLKSDGGTCFFAR